MTFNNVVKTFPELGLVIAKLITFVSTSKSFSSLDERVTKIVKKIFFVLNLYNDVLCTTSIYSMLDPNVKQKVICIFICQLAQSTVRKWILRNTQINIRSENVS